MSSSIGIQGIFRVLLKPHTPTHKIKILKKSNKPPIISMHILPWSLENLIMSLHLASANKNLFRFEIYFIFSVFFFFFGLKQMKFKQFLQTLGKKMQNCH